MCYILGVEKRDIMEKKGNKKKIKLDNNILVILGVFCAALLIVITLFNYYKKAQVATYGDEWKNKSFLVSEGFTNVSCDSLSTYLDNDYMFVYVTESVGTEEEFNLEKNLKKMVNDYKLQDHFVLFQTVGDNCGSINDAGSVKVQSLRLEKGLSKLPTIIYYKNGKVVDYIEREDEQMMSEQDFAQLLDKYEFKS